MVAPTLISFGSIGEAKKTFLEEVSCTSMKLYPPPDSIDNTFPVEEIKPLGEEDGIGASVAALTAKGAGNKTKNKKQLINRALIVLYMIFPFTTE